MYRSHYRNMLDAYGPLTLSGVDWKDPAKPKTCEVRLSLPEAGYREGSFVDGLPVRRAQPVVFNQVQIQLVEGVSRCGSDMAFTLRTWTELESSALALVLKNSGTTFCLQDSDCYATELTDPCGARPPQRVYGSNTTDAVFHIAYRKFLWTFLNMTAQLVNGSMGQLAAKHPDHGTSWGSERCPMRHWEERPLEAACVQNACRAKTP